MYELATSGQEIGNSLRQCVPTGRFPLDFSFQVVGISCGGAVEGHPDLVWENWGVFTQVVGLTTALCVNMAVMTGLSTGFPDGYTTSHFDDVHLAQLQLYPLSTGLITTATIFK